MTGLNGNGIGSIYTSWSCDKATWTIGLINSRFKYLSAETFGFRTNANGKSLKKKQIWLLQPSGDRNTVVLKSHLNKYVAVDSFGNVTCDQDEYDDSSKFEISVCNDLTGRWAFRSVSRSYFLGASAEALICSAKVPSDAELWYVHLAARPQVNLRSEGRKRFATLSEEQDEICVEENIPWGQNTLFTLEFRENVNKYAIHTCNNMYLQKDSKLVPQINQNCYFACEYHAGFIALRDDQGLYLAPIGSRAILKTRSPTVSKDELFSLESSLPQASFLAADNEKYISVKQGVDVTANQEEVSDYETFQLEFDEKCKKWYIRTMQDKYFALQSGGAVQASESTKCSNCLFDIIWHEDGSMSFKGNNGKYVGIKKSGHLFANCESCSEEKSRYYFYLMNRPILVLKCEQGFVGYKSNSSNKLECNKATYETIKVERAERGKVYFKGQSNKYIQVFEDSVTVNGDSPLQAFYLELRDPTTMCIKVSDGRYLCSLKNGGLGISDSQHQPASITQWEY